MKSKREWWMLVIALVGILLALYSVPLHYAPSSSSFCNVSETINCDKVNKSPWSVFMGVPVAILGLFAYLAIFFIILKRRAIQKFTAFTNDDFWQYVLYFIAFMFLFQLYLTFTEVFFIHAYCIICIASQVCTFLLLILGWFELEYHKATR